MPRAGKLLTVLLLALGVPVAAVAALRDLVAHHPVVAVLLVIGYECLVMLVTLLGKVVGGPIDRRTRQLGDLLDAALGRRMSPYGRYYRQHVRESLRFTQTLGLAIVGPFTPELDDVYVDVGLAPRSASQIPGHLLGGLPHDVTARYSITQFLDREKPVVLAVIGAAGSGKTTLLRNVARRAAAGEQGQRRNVPVLLMLRDHAARIAENPHIDLPTLLRSNGVTLKAKEPEGWWEHQLHTGRCLILLDGLDEVAAEAHRRVMVDWIGRQVAQYPNNDYVATSRPHGYRAVTISGATVLQVRPFTSEQVRHFLYGWYSATERFATRHDGRDGEHPEALEHIESRARERADDLLRRLAYAPALYDLTINPLLLTMIANVHRYGGVLPGSRAGLYREICESVLWRRREAINLPIGLPGPGKERLLASIAYEMMRRRVRDLASPDVAGIVESGLRRMSEIATMDDFLAEAQASGLVIERERHTYAFAHHTFGEYLAAKYVRDNGLQSVLIDSVNDPWWRETTLLYVTDADADEVVRACLDAATVSSLALAFECARVGGELAPDLRERLNQTLTEATHAPDPERRRLAAGVLAILQLSGLVTTAAGARICPRPVSTELYRLFLRSTGNPAPDGVAEFVAGPERPVTGVWASDARAFTGWVNHIIGTGDDAVLYRLPRRDEADDLGQKLASVSVTNVWVDPGPNGGSRLWRSPMAPGPDPHTLTRSALMTAALADVPHASGLPSLTILNAVTTAQIAALTLDRARDLAHDLVHARALDLTRDLTLDRALDRNLALTHDLALDLALDRALDQVRDLGLALDRALNSAFKPGRTLDSVQAKNLALALARHTPPIGSRTLGIFPILYVDLVSILQAAALARTRTERIDAASAVREVVMGSGLANAFLAAVEVRRRKGQPRRIDELATAFVRALAAPLEPEDRTFAIDLDALAPTLQDVCMSVRRAEDRTPWALYMTDQLAHAAVPIVTRRKRVTGDDATFIRLGAMALAAEPNGVAREELYTVAAGITLLQRRATDSPGTESIILARE